MPGMLAYAKVFHSLPRRSGEENLELAPSRIRNLYPRRKHCREAWYSGRQAGFKIESGKEHPRGNDEHFNLNAQGGENDNHR